MAGSQDLQPTAHRSKLGGKTAALANMLRSGSDKVCTVDCFHLAHRAFAHFARRNRPPYGERDMPRFAPSH